MVYVLALVIVLVLGAAGLGGLSSRLGVGAQDESASMRILTTSDGDAPAAAPVSDGNVPGASSQGESQAEGQSQPTAPPPAAQSAPESAPPAANNTPPQAQQSGDISGQATAPFYIVQEGDTLWGIAVRFDTTVDALAQANELGEAFIQAGQLLYLPQASQPAVPPPVAPAAPVGEGSPSMPTMPQTGINKEP
jgi:LysM repeat protein